MLRATLRSLGAHKVRLLLTAVAVILGVAFVTGTFVFTDTLKKTFDDLFNQTTADVVISPKQEFTPGAGQGGGDAGTTQALPAATLASVRGTEGVAKATGVVQGTGVRIKGADGTLIGGGGPPNLGVSWTGDEQLTSLRLTEGRPPAGAGEVAIDENTMKRGDLRLGQRADITPPAGEPISPTIVGVFRFGVSGSLGGATLAAFDTRTAQQLLLDGRDAYSEIEVKAADGWSQDALAQSLSKTLGSTVTVRTGQQAADDAARQISDALRFVNIFLLVFAGVALVVGSFIILNTFSMLVAQRARELALLRALGASRRQVTASVMGEAFVVGLVGSTIGLALGLLLALGLRGLLGAFGAELPGGALVVQPRTVVVAYLVGVLITLLAAYLPARRAARVAPVQALRDDVALPSRALHWRTGLGSALALLGVGALALSWPRSGSSAAQLVGVGAFCLLVASVMLAPAITGPVIGSVGAPVAALYRTPGRLAVENARRNPRRTAATASALMIGLMLVSAFAVLGRSTTASTDALIGQVLKADLVVTDASFQSFSPQVAQTISDVPGVRTVSGVQSLPAQVTGRPTAVTAIDPATLPDVVNLELSSGSLADLTEGTVAVDDKQSASDGYRVGSTVRLTFLSGERPLRVVAVYAPSGPFSGFLVDRATAAAAGAPVGDNALYVAFAPDADAAATKAAVEKAVEPFAGVQVQDQTEFKAQIRSQINQLLALIYALLALAVIIAVLGIVNTLALSVIERTREIGLVRAVGSTRSQTRRTIRLESLLIAVFGALLGLGLGVLFGVALRNALRDQGIGVLSVPWTQLLVFLAVAALVGVLAAVWPARRAARLDVLKAIATE